MGIRSLIILLGFLLVTKTNTAQNYDTIVDTTKQWSVVQYWFYTDWPTEDRFAAFTTGYRFRGDTVINNYHYKFLEECKDSLFEDWYRSDYLMRDDSAGRVYISDYQIEKLLYDYNLEANDTIWIFNLDNLSYCEGPIIIDSVGSEFIAGKERKVFYWWGLPFYVEGFGTYRGPLGIFTTYNVANCSWDLTCFQQNNEMLYQSEDNCYIYFDLTGIPDSPIRNRMKIYPNPASSQLHISVNGQQQTVSVAIINMQGQIIAQQAMQLPGSLPIGHLPSGYYLLRLHAGVAIYTQTFIKN